MGDRLDGLAAGLFARTGKRDAGARGGARVGEGFQPREAQRIFFTGVEPRRISLGSAWVFLLSKRPGNSAEHRAQFLLEQGAREGLAEETEGAVAGEERDGVAFVVAASEEHAHVGADGA